MLDVGFKLTSALRRIGPVGAPTYIDASGREGDVCAFRLAHDGAPFVVEAVSCRSMIVAPGDVFLATPGWRESTRWVVGEIPDGGLVPGRPYWVLAPSGVVGDLVSSSPLDKNHLAQVAFLGVVTGADGGILNIGQFALAAEEAAPDRGAPVFAILGTSAEVGKTTAGTTILRSLRQKGRRAVVVLKATGTSSLGELAAYRDFGALEAYDCVDFGLPTTYPSGRTDIAATFDRALDWCLSREADAVIVECGGDILGANVPVFLERLKRRRPAPTVVLAAADALGALGATRMLADAGLAVRLVTGPCTDTPVLQRRTQELCGAPAMNMTRGGAEDALG
ncbi:MAG TPA: hypothetical protein VF601_23415 [Beijerinckiaceae bacterium]|jgi:hypothetical protein